MRLCFFRLLSFDDNKDHQHYDEQAPGNNREPPQVCSDIGVFHFTAERKGRSATAEPSG